MATSVAITVLLGLLAWQRMRSNRARDRIYAENERYERAARFQV
jgi:hypothetical protein